MKNCLLVLMFTVLSTMGLSGCATKPVLEEQYSPKTIKHPPLQTESTVPKNGIAYLSYNYQSLIAFSLNEPLSIGLMLGKINISTSEILLRGTLSQKDVICTSGFAYGDLITKPYAKACFFDLGRTGTVTTVTAAPGSIWFDKDLDKPLTYSNKEVFMHQKTPLKREIVYSGLSESYLNFLYREYYSDIDIAKINQPVLVPFADLPAKINVKGVTIEVLAATDDKMTYKTISGFVQ